MLVKITRSLSLSMPDVDIASGSAKITDIKRARAFSYFNYQLNSVSPSYSGFTMLISWS